jgi:alpha-1,6-mannosyltransferase
MYTVSGSSLTSTRTWRQDAVNHLRRGLTFCDVSTFYTPTGGGIRTYHDAKLAWFSAQRLHRYVLIYPARHYSMEHVSSAVTIATAYGASVGAGYRLPVDIARIRTLVRDLRPDVLETGDPWFSGPLGLWFKRMGYVRGAVASFFHGDPLRTYVDPWVARARVPAVRRRLGDRASRWFFRVQRMYDLSLASSAGAEHALRAQGVRNVVRVPFGVDSLFLDAGRARSNASGQRRPVRLLYAGRLQLDKGVDLLLATIQDLLRRPDVTLSVAGSGPLADEIARIQHPRLTYLGYVADRSALGRIYLRHDVLLAPGPHETFGLAALEALASGMVVVGPRAGGTGELLRQLESPCVFEPGDRVSWLAAVDDAIDGDHRRRTLDGRRLASSYGPWHGAIAREVETYCEYLSHCTT